MCAAARQTGCWTWGRQAGLCAGLPACHRPQLQHALQCNNCSQYVVLMVLVGTCERLACQAG